MSQIALPDRLLFLGRNRLVVPCSVQEFSEQRITALGHEVNERLDGLELALSQVIEEAVRGNPPSPHGFRSP